MNSTGLTADIQTRQHTHGVRDLNTDFATHFLYNTRRSTQDWKGNITTKNHVPPSSTRDSFPGSSLLSFQNWFCPYYRRNIQDIRGSITETSRAPNNTRDIFSRQLSTAISELVLSILREKDIRLERKYHNGTAHASQPPAHTRQTQPLRQLRTLTSQLVTSSMVTRTAPVTTRPVKPQNVSHSNRESPHHTHESPSKAGKGTSGEAGKERQKEEFK